MTDTPAPPLTQNVTLPLETFVSIERNLVSIAGKTDENRHRQRNIEQKLDALATRREVDQISTRVREIETHAITRDDVFAIVNPLKDDIRALKASTKDEVNAVVGPLKEDITEIKSALSWANRLALGGALAVLLGVGGVGYAIISGQPRSAPSPAVVTQGR